MVKRFIAIAIVAFGILPTFGQEKKQWSIQAGIGTIEMLENKYNGEGLAQSEDQGNTFCVSADYWLSERVALTGGLVYEQQGMFTDLSDDIGLKKINMLGVNAGVKYYFFPKKWVIQPYVGASLYTNYLNLGRRQGTTVVVTEAGYSNHHATLYHDVVCPALSLAPQIGFDIHLFSSVSLCMAYDYRFGLWGSNKAQLKYIDGVKAGDIVGIDERNHRSSISVGLKMDFPVQPISKRARNNMLWLVGSWISSKAK
ncbi:MAG: hypothetical protein K5874_06920 [Bacteroidaceae bacterium]|nr:hypothetical protein [Bacteroidaceae bacterium]